MREWADFSVDEGDGGGAKLTLTGALLISSIAVLDRRFRDWSGGEVAEIDLSQAGAIDTVGAWTVWRFARDHDAKITGCTNEATRLIDAIKDFGGEADISPRRPPILERVPQGVGNLVVSWGLGVIRLVGFLGAMLVIFGPVSIHWPRRRARLVVTQ